MKRTQRRRSRFQTSENRATHDFKHESLSGKVRVETGMLQFENDWPGLFVRGDDAIGLVSSIRALLDFAEKSLTPDRVLEIAMELHRLSTIADLIDRDVVVRSKQWAQGQSTLRAARQVVSD